MERKCFALSAVVLSGAIALVAQSLPAQTAPDTKRDPAISEKMPSPSQREGTASTSQVSSDDIKNVKEALKMKGIDPGPINGTLDSKAQQALRQFQKANDLPVTGAVDQLTALKLGVTLGKDSSTGSAGSSMKRDQQGSSGKVSKEKGLE